MRATAALLLVAAAPSCASLWSPSLRRRRRHSATEVALDWGDAPALDDFEDAHEDDETYAPNWDTAPAEQHAQQSSGSSRVQPNSPSRWFACALLDWIAASPLARAVNQMSPSSSAEPEPEPVPAPPEPSRQARYAGAAL